MTCGREDGTKIWKGAGNCLLFKLLGTWTLTVLFISYLLTISMFMMIADSFPYTDEVFDSKFKRDYTK